MANFCTKCGTPTEGASFCAKCGNDLRPQVPSAPVQAAAVPAAPVSTPVAKPQGMGTAAKLLIALLVVIVVGGVLAVAATIYAAHKISEKAHAVSRQVLGEDSSSPASSLSSLLQKAGGSGSENSSEFKGNPCRFLSKEEVSRAAGIEIVRTQDADAGCSYIAKGDPADMTSKHMTAMLSSQTKARGETPDPKTMQMAQQIAGGFFKQQEESDKNLSAAAATGEVVILTVSFTSSNASLEMKLNRAAFNHIAQTGPVSSGTDSTAATGTGNLNGIGDEAYAMGGTGMIVRKGNTVAHFMFPECPCSTDAVKPLAKRVADQL